MTSHAEVTTTPRIAQRVTRLGFSNVVSSLVHLQSEREDVGPDNYLWAFAVSSEIGDWIESVPVWS